MTLIEFVAGLIFIKGLKIKLWDYSNRKGNIMGIICPSFSLIWLIVGSLYYFLLNPVLVEGISWISENLIYTYFVGAVIGAYSDLRFEEFKKEFKKRIKEIRSKDSH